MMTNIMPTNESFIFPKNSDMPNQNLTLKYHHFLYLSYELSALTYDFIKNDLKIPIAKIL